MIYLLIGYMWLFIHRPFEVWPALGTIRLELVYAILMVLYWLFFYPRKTWVRNRLTLAFGFFWLVFLLAWLSSPFRDTEKCTETFGNYLKAAFIYLLIMATVRDEGQLKTLTMGCFVAFAIYMTHSLWEFHNGRHQFRMGIPRMVGVGEAMNDPNTFASSILYVLFLTLAFWSEVKSYKERIFLGYFTGLSFVCIVLTGSRSAFVGFSCFILISLRKLFQKKLFLILALCSMPVLWGFIPDNLQNRFWTVIDPSVGPANAKESAEGRVQGFLDGVSLWEKNPVLGVGPGAHGQAMGHGNQAHNLYGQTLGETGTCGAVALLSVVICFLANEFEARDLYRRAGGQVGKFSVKLSGSVILVLTVLLIKGGADHNLYRFNWLWFGAFQAIAVNCLRIGYREAADAFMRTGGHEENGLEGDAVDLVSWRVHKGVP